MTLNNARKAYSSATTFPKAGTTSRATTLAVTPDNSVSSEGDCRIVLVDDHPLVREGLGQLISTRAGLKIVGEADTAEAALSLVREQKPDLVILDMSLADGDGLDLIKQIHAEQPRLPMLVVSMHEECVEAERALRAGARGYLMKKEPAEKIFSAISHVLRGEMFVSDRVKQNILEFAACGKRAVQEGGSSIDNLSNRERQVFQLIGEGVRTRQIAAQLNLSVKTIESYRENLKIKMNLRSGSELVQRAILWGRNQAAARREAEAASAPRP